MMNQRTATVNTILSVLKDRDVEYELNGEVPISEVLNDKDKADVRTILFEAFRTGKVTFKPEFQVKVDDDTKLRTYVSGLVNNWIKKAKEFNGDTAYVPKNPGSRAGQGDEQIRELKKLLKENQDDPEVKAEIQEAIDARLTEIKPEAAPVDTTKIPEHLRKFVK